MLNPEAIALTIRESLRRLEGFLELAQREAGILQEDISRLTQITIPDPPGRPSLGRPSVSLEPTEEPKEKAP